MLAGGIAEDQTDAARFVLPPQTPVHGEINNERGFNLSGDIRRQWHVISEQQAVALFDGVLRVIGCRLECDREIGRQPLVYGTVESGHIGCLS